MKIKILDRQGKELELKKNSDILVGLDGKVYQWITDYVWDDCIGDEVEIERLIRLNHLRVSYEKTK